MDVTLKKSKWQLVGVSHSKPFKLVSVKQLRVQNITIYATQIVVVLSII